MKFWDTFLYGMILLTASLGIAYAEPITSKLFGVVAFIFVTQMIIFDRLIGEIRNSKEGKKK